MNLEEFLTRYTKDDEHPVTEINMTLGGRDHSHFIIVRYGKFTMIINPLTLSDHLSVDCLSFVDGEVATAGAFGMTHGTRSELEDIGTASHGFPSAALIAVLLGEQTAS
jgi:hypothetical protein